MKLHEAQIDVIREVRDMMHNDPEASEYICVNVLRVVRKREGLPKDASSNSLSDAAKSILVSITALISAAINEHTSLYSWLYEEYGMGRVGVDESQRFAALGRLAWLDRILETGEIK